MKSISLRAALAGAVALASANAFALPPSAIDSTVVRVYVGGSTALDNSVENLTHLAVGGICQPGTLDMYYFHAAGNGSALGSVQNRVAFCTAAFTNTASSIPAAQRITAGTTKIAVFKESQGGSGNGISPVARGTPLQFIDFFSASNNVATACATTSSVGASGDFMAYTVHDCGATNSTASTVNRTPNTGVVDGINIIAPNAGVSDVDPDTFVGLGGVTNADATALTRKRQATGVGFNPIVSVPLFTALQRAQGLVSGTTEDTTSIDKMPTLSSPVLRGIFTGTILDASQIYSNGVKLSTLAGADTAIYICRRGDTSGTMTSFKIQFLGQGCSKNAATIAKFVSPDAGSACETSGCAWDNTNYLNDFVFAGSGSGDVRACMDYQTAQGRLAIGIASTEAKPNTTSSRWRYTKVDGAEPTMKAMQEGRYDFFMEATMNDKYTSTVSSGAQAIFDQAFSIVGNKSVIQKVNESWQNAAQIGVTVDATHGIGEGDTGDLDIPVPGTANVPAFPITAAAVRTNPVNAMKRGLSTANECNRTIMVTP